MRAFVAVALPEDVRVAIAAQVPRLRETLHDVTWTPPENLHTTLKFLGAVDDPIPLWRAVTDRLGSSAAFTVVARGLGAFPGPDSAKVIWAGIEDQAGRLSALASEVESVAARFGCSREQRAYTAHVTIGRVRRGALDVSSALAVAAGRPFGMVPVDAVVLYESRSGHTGPQYIERGRVFLGQGASHGDPG